MTRPPSHSNVRPAITGPIQDARSKNGTGFEFPIDIKTVLPGDPANLALPSAGAAGLAPVKRLIVLVPVEGIEETRVAQWVWQIASPSRLSVLFLGLCSDSSGELPMRRDLVMLASLTRDPRIKVETRLEFGKNWGRMVAATLTEGDIILCPAELRMGFRRRPVGQILARLGAPVWTMTGVYVPADRAPLREIVFWFVSIAILTGFLFIQVRIARLAGDWVQNTLFIFSMSIEVALLWTWHHLSS